MNSFACLAFFAVVTAAHAGLLAPAARIIQRPSSRTTLVGPEGSVISAVAPGGQIITDELPGVVAHTAPVIATHTAPIVAASPLIAAPAVLAHSAPLVASPILAGGLIGERSVIAGPSGTIATGRTLATPALAAPIWA